MLCWLLSWIALLSCYPRLLSWITLLACSPELALLECSPGKLSWDCFPRIALLGLLSWDGSTALRGLPSWNPLLGCSAGLLSWAALLDVSPGLLSWIALPDCSRCFAFNPNQLPCLGVSRWSHCLQDIFCHDGVLDDLWIAIQPGKCR